MSDDPFIDADRASGPIDAQFEPAPPRPDGPARAAPGWLALGGASAAAALVGAVAGLFGADLLPGSKTRELAAAQARLEVQVGQIAALQSAIDQKLSEPAAASAELAGLIGELDTVSRRLDEAIAAGGDPTALASLTARIDAIERGRPASPLASASADVAALSSRLASLESERLAASRASAAEAASSSQRADAALAVSAIESAIRRGSGFEADYRALRSAMPASSLVKRLAPYVSGVPALSGLQAEFPSVRGAVLAAATPEKTSGRLSWIDKAFGDAVSVRPANGKHTAVTRALDTAGAALTAGDLKASVAALSILDGAAAKAAEDWLRRANRRIALEAALEDVRLGLAEDGAQVP